MSCDNSFTEAMTPDFVTEYLEHAARLEKTVYTYSEILKRTEQKIRKLSNLKKAPEFSAAGKMAMVLIAVILVLYGFVLFKIATLSPAGLVVAIVLGVIFLPVTLKLISIFIKGIKTAKRIKNFKTSDMERAQNQLFIMKQLNLQQGEIKTNLDATTKLLNKLYDMEVIAPEYRNLSAAVTLLEYFKCGRCSSLTGKNGGYELFNAEQNKDTVINGLKNTISQLEKDPEFSEYNLLVISENLKSSAFIDKH